jgi:hypothetical protein
VGAKHNETSFTEMTNSFVLDTRKG